MLLNLDETRRVYFGAIGDQSVTLYIRDWSGTYGGSDMSPIQIMFTAQDLGM